MTTVFVNGCFDVLHRAHVMLLNHARSLGTRLIVAIDSDERVRQLKGPTRPRNSQWDRQFILAALRAVDEVHVFNSSEELEKLTQTLQPDIMVVGSDYRHKTVIGSQYTKELVFFDRIPHLSTTAILENSPIGRELL